MSNSLCFSPVVSFKPRAIPVLITGNCSPRTVDQWIKDATRTSKYTNFSSLEIKASDNDQNTTSTKRTSLLCKDCKGDGIIKCRKCEGTGANIVDHFNGMFKVGAVCWLCSGRKEILCGNCNGAGFMGGFMSALED